MIIKMKLVKMNFVLKAMSTIILAILLVLIPVLSFQSAVNTDGNFTNTNNNSQIYGEPGLTIRDFSFNVTSVPPSMPGQILNGLTIIIISGFIVALLSYFMIKRIIHKLFINLFEENLPPLIYYNTNITFYCPKFWTLSSINISAIKASSPVAFLWGNVRSESNEA